MKQAVGAFLRYHRGALGSLMTVAVAGALSCGALCIGALSTGAIAQVVADADVPEHVDFRLDFGALSLEPLVQVQLQGTPYVGDDAFLQAGDPAEQPGFRLRRARLGFRGMLYDMVSFAVTTELASGDDGTAKLLDAAVGYHHWNYLQLVAGAHMVPYSRSAMEGSGDIALIERPMAVRSLSPGRQVGLQLYGNVFDGALQYHAGVYNGFQRGNNLYDGYVNDPATLGNRFDGVAYVARLASEPLGPLTGNIQDLYESDYRLGLGGGYFYSNGTTRDIQGAGADLLMHWMGAHFLAEFMWQKATPDSQPTQVNTVLDEVTSTAFLVEIGYTIIQRIGIQARFEWFDPNDKIDDETDMWAATGGVSYHFIGNALKVQMDYTHREERFGKSIDNDILLFQLGLNLGGLP